MHELSLTQSIVATVVEEAAGRKVTRVTLEIGKLSAVMPDAIRFCFDIVADGTVLEGAVLDIIEPEARACCADCGAEVLLHAGIGRCACGSLRLDILAGEELNIKSMELAGEAADAASPALSS